MSLLMTISLNTLFIIHFLHILMLPNFLFLCFFCFFSPCSFFWLNLLPFTFSPTSQYYFEFYVFSKKILVRFFLLDEATPTKKRLTQIIKSWTSPLNLIFHSNIHLYMSLLRHFIL